MGRRGASRTRGRSAALAVVVALALGSGGAAGEEPDAAPAPAPAAPVAGRPAPSDVPAPGAVPSPIDPVTGQVAAIPATASAVPAAAEDPLPAPPPPSWTKGYKLVGENRDSASRAFALPDGRTLVVGATASNGSDAVDVVVGRFLANGRPDPTFGTGGLTVIRPSTVLSYATDVFADAAGRVYVTGMIRTSWPYTDTAGFVTRLTAAGQVDTGYGIGGHGYLDFAFSDVATAGSVDAVGRVVVAVYSDRLPGPLSQLVRLTASGVQDPTFGTNGVVDVQPDNVAFFNPPSFNRLAIDGLGRITAITGGVAYRFLVDGQPDPTFGGDGIATSGAGTSGGLGDVRANGGAVFITSMFVEDRWEPAVTALGPTGAPDPTFGGGQPVPLGIEIDGRPVVVTSIRSRPDGGAWVGGYVTREASTYPGTHVLARVSSTGHLDPAFGTGGHLQLPISPDGWLNDIATRPGGGAIVVGHGARWDAPTDLTGIGVTASGAIDRAFGRDGLAVAGVRGPGFSAPTMVAVDAHQRTVMVAYGNRAEVVSWLVRLLPDGTLDAAFGGGGMVELPRAYYYSDGGALAVRDDGSIVIAAATYEEQGLMLLDYGADGTLRRQLRQSSPADARDFPMDLVVLPDGGTVVAGITNENVYPSYCSRGWLEKRFADGSLDAGFGHGGRLILPTAANGSTCSNRANVMALADGAVIVGLTTRLADDSSRPQAHLVRVGLDGTVDTGFAVLVREAAVRGVAVDTHGRVVVATTDLVPYSTGPTVLHRFLADGRRDASFGGGTVPVGDEPSSADSVVVDGNDTVTVSVRISLEGLQNRQILHRYLADGALAPGWGDAAGVELPSSPYATLLAASGSTLVVATTESTELVVRKWGALRYAARTTVGPQRATAHAG